jgi:hypothetical protein
MSITAQHFIRAILSQPITDVQTAISESMLPLLEHKCSSVQTKLSVMLMIFENSQGSLEARLDNIKTLFGKIIGIVEDHELKLPEEDCIVETVVKEISEEGEGAAPAPSAPANVTAGIEPTVPRIKPRKTKEVEDGTD